MNNRYIVQLLTVIALIALAMTIAVYTPSASANDDDDRASAIQGKPELTYPKLGSNLDRLATSGEKEPAAPEDTTADGAAHQEEPIAVTIYLSSNVENVVQFLENNGGDPRNIGYDYIEAYVPTTLLGALSERDGVERVREIIPPESTYGNYTSEGVAAHLATAWHDKGYMGQGIKVGIIDNGFEGFSDLMGEELPSTVIALCYTDLNVFSSSLADCETNAPWGNTPHGTAVAENVIDMAPEVSLYIATYVSYGDLRNVVDWMISEGVSVINRSLGGQSQGPGDGTSPFSYSHLNTIDRAVEGGIVFLNSAGNSASETWFQKGPPSILDSDGDGDGWIKFGSDTDNSVGRVDRDTHTQRLSEGTKIGAYLRWEDAWPRASTNIDLYLYESNSNEIIARATDPQGGRRWDVPTETLFTEIPKDGEYELMLFYRGGGLPDWIQLVAPKTGLLEHRTDGYSIKGASESANPGMLTVGATHYWDTHTIAEYSSQGPTVDGRIKPDIVGSACGKTASYESHSRDGNLCSYAGTSSASPHVAGLAALVKQRFPDYTPAQIASYLKRNAEQREEPDPNNTWGYGFAVLPAPEPPIAPIMLRRGDDSNGPNWIRFTWEMSPTGREPVTSFTYHLEQQIRGEGQTDEVWDTHSREIIEVSSSGTASPSQYATVMHTTITGLTPEQTYRFSVSATNIWGEGPYSEAEIRETTAAVPPSSPLGLTIEPSENEENAVVLRWQAPEDNGGAHVSGYVIQATIGPEKEWLDVITTDSPETSYIDYWDDDNGPAFEFGQSIYYRIAAINSVGVGSFSEPGIIETTAAVPPSSPLGLTIELFENEENAVVLRWQAPEDNGGAHVSGYVIQATIGPEKEWLDVITTDSPETSYIDYWNDDNGPAFEFGQSIYYRVAAINSAGTGSFSDEVTAGDRLVLRYDTNRNGIIEKSEVIAAINEYLFGDGAISKEDVIKLINVYLFG